MIINVINLAPEQKLRNTPASKKLLAQDTRRERALSIVQQSKEQGFAVRFWEGVVDKFAYIGINKAFKNIVADAKVNDFPMVCIAEDDMIFTAPGAWKYYLDNIPSSFDIYSGGIYAGQLNGNRIVNGYSGHTLITVHQRFYDFFLSVTDQDHLDRRLGNYAFEKEYIVPPKFCVKQLGGYSDNHGRSATYESYEENWEYFTGIEV